LAAELELQALPLEELLGLGGDLVVHAGQDAVEVFEHGDLRAQPAHTEPSSSPM
jgi:hypothetical protein